MPYHEEIEARILKIVAPWENTASKKMFGGICHPLDGKMFCGVYKDFLILRLGEQTANDALRLPGVRAFDITGRPMRGWVMVERSEFQTDDELESWLNKAKTFVDSLPRK